MNRVNVGSCIRPMLTAIIAIAITLIILLCSGGGGNDEPPIAGDPSSSSDGAEEMLSSCGGGGISSSSLADDPSSSSETVVTCGDWETTKEPTCTEVGSKTRTCNGNESQKETAEIALLTWSDDWTQTTAPTCEADGVETRTCSDGTSKTRKGADKLSWSDWKQTTAPTCDTKGVDTRTCENNAQAAQTRTEANETTYNHETQLCYEHEIIEKFCGDNKQEYDPGKYECKPSINPNGIYLKGKLTDSRDSKEYEAVLIGEQTWMAENLNFNAEGSVYYQNNEATYGKYGRLYNWATTLVIDESCNTKTLANCEATVLSTNHTGICPQGWHIPNAADWNALIKYIHTDNGLASFSSGTSNFAGKYLKATSGWNSSGNGTDTYGFAALPGGYGNSDGYLGIARGNGGWWSSFEGNANYAYYRYMGYYGEGAYWDGGSKTSLLSVRCLQD